MGILWQGFLLGAIGGIVPGAILTVLLLSVLQGGLRAGLRAFCWALCAEIIVAGSLLFAATLLPLTQGFFIALGSLGGVVLFYFAWSVFKLKSVEIENQSNYFDGQKIFLLAATNAPLYVFWTTICFPLIWELAQEWNLAVAATSYFLVFEIGWGITTFAMMIFFVYSRSTLTNERIMRMVFSSIALLLVLLGARMLITSAAYFF